MNAQKILTIAIALALAGLAVINYKAHKENQRLTMQLASVSHTVSNADLLISSKNETIDSLQNKVGQLVEVLTNSTAKIQSLSNQIREFEDKQKLTESEAEQERLIMSQVPAPRNERNADNNMAWVFPKLLDKTGRLLASNAEFARIYGRSMIFRPQDRSPLAVDVLSVHPAILKHLKIDVALAMAAQEAIDRKMSSIAADNARRAVITAAENAEQARINTLALAERAKAQEEWRVKSEAERNERLKAEAAMKAADAAMFQAQNPSSIVIQNANQNLIRQY